MINLVSCVSVDYHNLLVPHFLKYYEELGVDKFHFILNVQERFDNLKELEKLLNRNNIEIYLWEGEFTTDRKLIELKKIFEKLKGWIIISDVDEFQDYETDNLKLFFQECDKQNISLVTGILQDRISRSKKFEKVKEKEDIFEQFPLEIKFDYERYDFKLIAFKDFIETNNGGFHRFVSDGRIQHSKSFKIWHFKWIDGIVEYTKKRRKVFKRKNLPHFVESDEILDKIQIN